MCEGEACAVAQAQTRAYRLMIASVSFCACRCLQVPAAAAGIFKMRRVIEVAVSMVANSLLSGADQQAIAEASK